MKVNYVLDAKQTQYRLEDRLKRIREFGFEKYYGEIKTLKEEQTLIDKMEEDLRSKTISEEQEDVILKVLNDYDVLIDKRIQKSIDEIDHIFAEKQAWGIIDNTVHKISKYGKIQTTEASDYIRAFCLVRAGFGYHYSEVLLGIYNELLETLGIEDEDDYLDLYMYLDSTL